VGITNKGNIETTVNVGTVGSLTSSLGLSSNRTLLPSGWEPILNAANTIMTLANINACAAGGVGVCATNSYTDTDGITKYHDYRYRGAEPNNYVWFNNDMYRIIGVFDENSHGVERKYLIKLIATNKLMSSTWGIYNTNATSGIYSNYKNDWTGNTTGVKANLNLLLNEYFYIKNSVSSTHGTCNNWRYYLSDTNYRNNECSNIIGYGIDSSLRNYIEDATWYLYGYSGSGLSKQNWYLCERGQYSGCTSGNSGAYDISTIEKIGLMYISDYLYASGYYSNDDITTPNSYFGEKNWLYSGSEWTITPTQGTTKVRFITAGSISTKETYQNYNVRPTFYLKSSVYITGGDGTFDNPYTITK